MNDEKGEGEGAVAAGGIAGIPDMTGIRDEMLADGAGDGSEEVRHGFVDGGSDFVVPPIPKAAPPLEDIRISETETGEPLVVKRVRGTTTMKVATYECMSPKCQDGKNREKGSRTQMRARYYPEESVLTLMSCYACHEGTNMADQDRVNQMKGMQIVNLELVTYMPIGSEDIVEPMTCKVPVPDARPGQRGNRR